MKKWLQNIGMRIVACVICGLSTLGLIVSLAGMVFYINHGDEEKFRNNCNLKLMENYALYAVDHLEDENLEDLLDQINVYVTIEKIAYDTEETELLFSNIPQDKKVSLITSINEEVLKGKSFFYSTDSLLQAMKNSIYSLDFYKAVPITGYVFDKTTGLFYFETSAGYFKIDFIDAVRIDGLSYDFSLWVKDGQEYYYNGYYDIRLDPDSYENWELVVIGGQRLTLARENQTTGNIVRVIDDISQVAETLPSCSYYWQENKVYYSSMEYDSYRIQVALDEDLTKQDLFQELNSYVSQLYSYQNQVFAFIWLFVFLLMVGVVLLVLSAHGDRERLVFFHKIPLGIFTLLFGAAEVGLVAAFVAFLEFTFRSTWSDWTITIDGIMDLLPNLGFIICVIFYIWLVNLITRIKTGTLFRYSELYYITRPIAAVAKMVRNHTSIVWKGIIAMIALTVIEAAAFLPYVYHGNAVVIFGLVKVFECGAVIWVLVQMKMLKEGVNRVAAGEWSKPIETQKMIWEFKQHGEAINRVGEGIGIAVSEQLKSERFKTELITNVSHDIKTPLTSIVNYVDLIKKEKVEDKTLAEYIEVLDRQSARLKKLIEDLMEASKASTGNLAVHFEECDMGVLMSQVIGEFEDRLLANGLEPVLQQPEQQVKVIADGRHLWRVLENLMNNVCKYSQSNTRVYMTLSCQKGIATVVFKNISKHQLNIPSDQLMERFVRGDSSRNTEGSGLGLSIAQSLTELMNGTLSLDIDGDLFKVTLTFRAIE